jgi:hypothetical protein
MRTVFEGLITKGEKQVTYNAVKAAWLQHWLNTGIHLGRDEEDFVNGFVWEFLKLWAPDAKHNSVVYSIWNKWANKYPAKGVTREGKKLIKIMTDLWVVRDERLDSSLDLVSTNIGLAWINLLTNRNMISELETEWNEDVRTLSNAYPVCEAMLMLPVLSNEEHKYRGWSRLNGDLSDRLQKAIRSAKRTPGHNVRFLRYLNSATTGKQQGRQVMDTISESEEEEAGK